MSIVERSVFTEDCAGTSLGSRRKRDRGRGAKTREKNGVPGDFSPAFLLPSPSPFTPATQAMLEQQAQTAGWSILGITQFSSLLNVLTFRTFNNT